MKNLLVDQRFNELHQGETISHAAARVALSFERSYTRRGEGG